MSNHCTHCGSVNMILDESTADTSCQDCGIITSSLLLVDGPSFYGQSGDQRKVQSSGQAVQLGGALRTGLTTATTSMELHRDVALKRGVETIESIADTLNLNQHHFSGAQRMFGLALSKGVTRGRRREQVAAACLYAMCRRDNSPFLLVDFADALEIPVRKLARTFISLCRALRITVSNSDPSFFMDRYTSQIPLIVEHNVQQHVAASAIKVVQSMERDWLLSGRRPSGVIGAALVVACRIHGFTIHPEDISGLVRAAPSTIAKRMSEFMSTSLALVEKDDLDDVELEELPRAKHPPALKSHLKRLMLKERCCTQAALPMTPSEDTSLASDDTTMIEWPSEFPPDPSTSNDHLDTQPEMNEWPVLPLPTPLGSLDDMTDLHGLVDTTATLSHSFSTPWMNDHETPRPRGVLPQLSLVDRQVTLDLLGITFDEHAADIVTPWLDDETPKNTPTETLWSTPGCTPEASYQGRCRGGRDVSSISDDDMTEEELTDIENDCPEFRWILLTAQERRAKGLVWDSLVRRGKR